MVRISEIDRRKDQINEVDPNNPLLLIALDCLKDRADERPSAKLLCERIAAFKGSLEYNESMREQGCNSMELKSLRQQVQDLRQINLSHSTQLEEKDHANAQKDLIIDQNKHAMSAKECEIQKLRQQLQQMIQHMRKDHSQPFETSCGTESFTLHWRKGKRAFCEMYRRSDAVVDGNRVYIRISNSQKICVYYNNTWSELPNCMFCECPITIIAVSYTHLTLPTIYSV